MRTLLFLSLAFGLGACGGDQETTDPTPQAPKPASTTTGDLSGAEIFKASCAMCHGETGDGKGIVKLDRPARSFLDGGFSFGNTPEAVYRTVTNGIGGTPMPGFASALSEVERHRVAQYVIDLGPEQIIVLGSESIMEVKDQPLFARGQFKSVAQGAPEVQRGLLAGTLDGLSFQYRIDDVRLIAVRQGKFVNRTDWTGRGGTPLEPLGKIIHLIDKGNPPPMFELLTAEGEYIPLRSRLRSTRTTSPPPRPTANPSPAHSDSDQTKRYPWLIYDVIHGDTVLGLREHAWAISYASASGYVREFDYMDNNRGSHKSKEGTIILAANRTTEGHWIRAGSIAYRTQYQDEPAGIGASYLKITHTVLLLPDSSDETYKKLMQELTR